MNAVAVAAVAALVTSTVVLLGLTGLANIPAEGYGGLGLLLTGCAITAWGREELELAREQSLTGEPPRREPASQPDDAEQPPA